MASLEWIDDAPQLRSPVLVCAFRGWNDAASSASTAIETIALEMEDVRPFARIDPEEFFDFQVNRPNVSLISGTVRDIEWPQNDFIAVRAPDAARDMVILDGTEPNLKWRTFTEAIMEVVDTLGVTRVITLGSLLAEVAHSMPVPVTALASDPELVNGLDDLRRSDYEGPTGVVGVVHDGCRKRAIESASLWAAVPHYVAAITNPKASLALLGRLEHLTGITVGTGDLEQECSDYDRQVDRAVAANDEIGEMVERIESEQTEALDEEDDDALTEDGLLGEDLQAGEDLQSEEDIPSGDALASEFQRFLEQRRDS